ncbi:hypothetical protein [uncultured Stenotrophomonas sp.]|uniref:hypothetical protein n=1 Tax=uncultured Stenotrophomonas sp. TaxID=165438 RepID=UPI0028E24370|nr:hypothetical protein [uncultured Stenotrophomonas sp.]
MTPQNDSTGTRRRTLIQHWGAVLWPSFIAAGLASVVFFAFVDPLRLRDISFPGHAVSRELGYTLGFFMFWAVTAMASAVTGYLLRPLPRDDDELPLG